MTDSFELIHVLLKSQAFKKAINCLVDSKSGNLKREYRWDANHAWYCVGLAKYDLGEFQEAALAFRRALRANSTDVQSLHALGDCYDELNRSKLAERMFRKALRLRPKGKIKASLTFNLGNALFDQRQYAQAIELFRTVARRADDVGEKARKNLVLAEGNRGSRRI